MSEELLSINGIGRVLMNTLITKYQITDVAQFLNASEQTVARFDARLKKIWVREQLKGGKQNPALSAQDIDAAACERAVFEETKRTLVEVDASVVKAQDECKGPGAEKLESAINRQAWKTWVENLKTKNKVHVQKIKDFMPSVANPVSPFVVIESSTVPVWACDRAMWVTLFGKENIFKGAGPDEVFSDTVGALFYALTHKDELLPPDTFLYLNSQLENLMGKYKMPFFRFLVNYYADWAVAVNQQAFSTNQLSQQSSILFFAKYRIEPMHSDTSVLNSLTWTAVPNDDFVFVFRASVDRKDDTATFLGLAGLNTDIGKIAELVATAPKEFERGRRNFCEAYLRLYKGMEVRLNPQLAAHRPTGAPEKNALVKIILAERGPVASMFAKLGITIGDLNKETKPVFAALLRDAVIDKDTLDVALTLIGSDLECWKILFDKDHPEPWKRRLMFKQGANTELTVIADAALVAAKTAATNGVPVTGNPATQDPRLVAEAEASAEKQEPWTNFEKALKAEFP